MEHPKRVHSEELSSESDWLTSESKKKRRKKKKELGVRAASPMDSGSIPPPAERPNEDDSNPTRPSGSGTSRFKVKTTVPEPFELVTALSNDPRLKFRASPNRYGEFILYSRDHDTTEQLQKLDQLEMMTEKLNRAVILYYPIQLPLSAVESLPAVTSVYRCTSKSKEPLRKLVATFRGPVPEKIDLKVWGSFPTATYTPEPLRCYRCQKFGHHQARCTNPNPVCGVCSGHHRTEECIAKLKEKRAPTAKCPNCDRKHHAWSPFCRARIDRIKEDKAKQSPKTAAPAPAQVPALPQKPAPKLSWSSYPPLPQPKPQKKQMPPRAPAKKADVATQVHDQLHTYKGKTPRIVKEEEDGLPNRDIYLLSVADLRHIEDRFKLQRDSVVYWVFENFGIKPWDETDSHDDDASSSPGSPQMET